MQDKNDLEFLTEQAYLEETKAILKRTIDRLFDNQDKIKEKIRVAREDLAKVQPASGVSDDSTQENGQFLTDLENDLTVYEMYNAWLKSLGPLTNEPYFGRVDFDGYSNYIGRAGLIDERTNDPAVIDWRAPISTLYYQGELGKTSFMTPEGEVTGELSLKRQFDIKEAKLISFFDTDVNIKDPILAGILAKGTTPKMKTIVETLQKAQDQIIRLPKDANICIQGSAGSGKTSLAMHRAAYLMYRMGKDPLKASEIIIISPNDLFSKYVDSVLPELGEENIPSLTFNDVFSKNLEDITFEDACDGKNYDVPGHMDDEKFFTSFAMGKILDRLEDYYEKSVMEIPDFYYNGKYIATKEEIRAGILKEKKDLINGKVLPLSVRLNHAKTRLSLKLDFARRSRFKELYDFVDKYPWHSYETKSFARLLSMKRSFYLTNQLNNLSAIDITSLYKSLFTNDLLFKKLSRGIKLPENIEDIRARAKSRGITRMDMVALTYLKYLLEGSVNYPNFKQVIVDEAQDYGPLHYKMLKIWFPKASFTVLGDINQSLLDKKSMKFYNNILVVLNGSKADIPSMVITLKDSFRSTYEITEYSKWFAAYPELINSFDRHGTEIRTSITAYPDETRDELKKVIRSFRESGLKTIAILTKDAQSASDLYMAIRGEMAITLALSPEKADLNRSMIMPVRLAKGLEFDGCIIYDIDSNTEIGRRLSYVACTRALHRLAIIKNKN